MIFDSPQPTLFERFVKHICIYIFLSLKRRKTRILFNASITLDFALNYANYHAQKLCSGLSKIDAKNHWIYNLP